MKARYRLLCRGNRGGGFYAVDSVTGKRESLETSVKHEAERLIMAKNEADRQPALNLQIAKAYLAGADPAMTTRTWRDALEALAGTKHGANQERWKTVAQDKALALLLPKTICETRGDILLQVLRKGTVSTNVFLRRLHNFCVDMNWLAWPLVPKRQWPAVRFKEKRAVTAEEHQRIIAAEIHPDRKAFYDLCWHLGGSQGDIALLTGESVDWVQHTVAFHRKKTKVPVIFHLGPTALSLLRDLPAKGFLFPRLANMKSSDRATEFRERCEKLGIFGITLHSYRYSWAGRAKQAGYPERFAQESLGHGSKAVHRTYAAHALMRLPSLESYEAAARAQQATPSSSAAA